jgi:hypothetical protein
MSATPETGPATRFALGALATWRVAHLLAEEDGPADAVVRLRARLGTGPVGQLMDCFACVSIWVAAPIAVATARRRRETPLHWLALSGAACLLERASRQPDWLVGAKTRCTPQEISDLQAGR